MWKSDLYNYKRRATCEIVVGALKMGGANPVRIQSMANTNTNDIESSVAQCARIVDAGADLVRFTTQGLKEVDSLREIHNCVQTAPWAVPLVADVHFNAAVADSAATTVEKVRVNPGNYVAGIKSDTSNGYTPEEYAQEFLKIKERFTAFLNICKANNTAIRIGVNHGSLSERMLLTWGDTAKGMVESCMEFLRICRKNDFSNLVISMKASNTVMMIQAVRLLVEQMELEGFCFPIHLGVTEAGDGEDGRVKSAVGIGGLLAEGIGDTIRVSLSEEPEAEIPVARLLADYITARADNERTIAMKSDKPMRINAFERRKTKAVAGIGGENIPAVIALRANHATLKSDFILENNTIVNEAGVRLPILTPDKLSEARENEAFLLQVSYDTLTDELLRTLKRNPNIIILLEANAANPVGEMRAVLHTLVAEGVSTPVVLHGRYAEDELEALQVKAAADLGIIFVDGLADGVLIDNSGSVGEEDILSLAFGILQASRVRVSKTEFISCPGCGRTLFELQDVIARVKAKTSHLTGLKIGIMGCIVNGPGEMADSDYGYVGAARGKVSLYKKHECIEKNVPAEAAVEKLIDLIKLNGDWREPES